MEFYELIPQQSIKYEYFKVYFDKRQMLHSIRRESQPSPQYSLNPYQYLVNKLKGTQK